MRESIDYAGVCKLYGNSKFKKGVFRNEAGEAGMNQTVENLLCHGKEWGP